ncbi:hypothetical protein ABGV49_20135 [Chromobacterium vaccinii]|uniref:Uncharacterized protein n=1 Tax=Chromobacterium vaccinii TaxID=1108595 RepID=A0ABV0FL82_9NEIS
MEIANARGKARRISDAILKTIVETVTIFMPHPPLERFRIEFPF